MKYCRVSLPILILLNLSFQQSLQAQPVSGHLVPVEDLQRQLTAQSKQRLQNIEEIQKLLRHELVQQQMGKLLDLEKVELALVTLDDETLQKLATESEQVNDQIEAGITIWGWIGIAILAAIVIIVLSILLAIQANES